MSKAKGEVQSESGEILKGPKPANLQRDRGGGSEQRGGKSVGETNNKQQPQGDERTPDKPIGQVAYADGQQKTNDGGAGKPQTSNLEPEKQGGIGGP